jgi:hypothetical protein
VFEKKERKETACAEFSHRLVMGNQPFALTYNHVIVSFKALRNASSRIQRNCNLGRDG